MLEIFTIIGYNVGIRIWAIARTLEESKMSIVNIPIPAEARLEGLAPAFATQNLVNIGWVLRVLNGSVGDGMWTNFIGSTLNLTTWYGTRSGKKSPWLYRVIPGDGDKIAAVPEKAVTAFFTSLLGDKASVLDETFGIQRRIEGVDPKSVHLLAYLLSQKLGTQAVVVVVEGTIFVKPTEGETPIADVATDKIQGANPDIQQAEPLVVDQSSLAIVKRMPTEKEISDETKRAMAKERAIQAFVSSGYSDDELLKMVREAIRRRMDERNEASQQQRAAPTVAADTSAKSTSTPVVLTSIDRVVEKGSSSLTNKGWFILADTDLSWTEVKSAFDRLTGRGRWIRYGKDKDGKIWILGIQTDRFEVIDHIAHPADIDRMRAWGWIIGPDVGDQTPTVKVIRPTNIAA
jgi:hypothetical protein